MRYPTALLVALSPHKVNLDSRSTGNVSTDLNIGYWVPFEAAKAVAATFCYRIRYVLVPVFGPDFVSMCQRSEDSTNPCFRVDASIIQRYTEAVAASQVQSRESSVAVSPRTTTPYDNVPQWPPKPLGTKSAKTMDDESGYGTDSERSEQYQGSPESPGSAKWTPVNTPTLAHMDTYRFLQQPPRNITSTPRGLEPSSSPRSKRRTKTKRVISDIEETSATDVSSDHCSMYTPTSPKRRKISPIVTDEMRAAYALMELHKEDAKLGEKKTLTRRRASA